ncbi:mucosal addressin cell adhesion molecule 1 isoform X2 [Ammospiza nelsoni]|uniref:mucosal addressin cell adhesion molecule 1 isoform X2 n=1 Tax=Ammospiza nelsoni TaxID=2857394 RepID=UPI00286C4941|nr:mucosal addressin cell adhesion molecule 1 isoform X2 [Ammospiza nelsoni]
MKEGKTSAAAALWVMEPAPVLLLLLLGSLWGCSGGPADRMVVTPREPVVPFGGSTELNCSLACAGGKVEWRGLDTALGTISSFSTHSILHIQHATVATEGMKFCEGKCHGKDYKESVTLKVYALPDTLSLEASPHTLRPGHPATLTCSATQVYPPTGLVLTWYRGHHVLENLTDPDCEDPDEEELCSIVSSLPVKGTEVAEGMEFRCEVTLRVGQETFSRVASLVARAEAVMTPAVATSTGSPSTATVATTALPPGPGVPTGDPTTTRDPNAGTTQDLAAVTNAPSTEPSVPQDPTASTHRADVATSTLPAATEPPLGTMPACSLQMRSLPPTGTRGRALRIECHARCTGNATVRWLRTPAALGQYREESAGSSSALRLDSAEPWHQGRYQCVLRGHHRAQVASLEVMVVDDSFSSSPAIAMGTAGSLLGLIATAAVSRRLWKWFRSR